MDRDAYREIDGASFEEARAGCGPESADPRLFVYQAESGGCRIDPALFERHLDRLELDVRGEGPGRTVVGTIDSLSDDSIRSERHLFELELRSPRDGGAPRWTIVWVGATHRCWEGRGHEGFGTAPCL